MIIVELESLTVNIPAQYDFHVFRLCCFFDHRQHKLVTPLRVFPMILVSHVHPRGVASSQAWYVFRWVALVIEAPRLFAFRRYGRRL